MSDEKPKIKLDTSSKTQANKMHKGKEIGGKMKADPKLAKIPVIILSNLGQQDDMKKAMEIGATDYLIKAHKSPSEIIDKIRSITE